MANLQLIKDIAERKKITLESIATQVGISPQQLHLIVRKNSTKIETLEKIAEVLNVSPCVFFDDRAGTKIVKQTNRYGNNLNETHNNSSELMSIIEKKDEQIDSLLSIIKAMQQTKA